MPHPSWLFIFAVLLLPARPHIIDFDKEIATAKTIRYGRVKSYTDSTIAVACPATPAPLVGNCKFWKLAADMRNRMLKNNKWPGMLKGFWPPAGDSVLVVLGEYNEVRMLAIKKGNDYQFWDPSFDINGSWFRFSAPARPTAFCAGMRPGADTLHDCSDGCLYPISRLPNR